MLCLCTLTYLDHNIGEQRFGTILLPYFIFETQKKLCIALIGGERKNKNAGSDAETD